MGRSVRQKRKNRSSRATVRPNTNKKKNLNPTGNKLIADNWNKKETLTQNYRRLGLLTRLQKPAGGTQPGARTTFDTADSTGTAAKKSRKVQLTQPFAITPAAGGLREVRVERDADGKIVRILEEDNPLDDMMNALDSEEEEENPNKHEDMAVEEWGGLSESEEDGGEVTVARQLEKMARVPRAKKARYQSEREREWLGRLVERYGDDVEAMARDRKLNPMQQTVADLRRRIGRMKA